MRPLRVAWARCHYSTEALPLQAGSSGFARNKNHPTRLAIGPQYAMLAGAVRLVSPLAASSQLCPRAAEERSKPCAFRWRIVLPWKPMFWF